MSSDPDPVFFKELGYGFQNLVGSGSGLNIHLKFNFSSEFIDQRNDISIDNTKKSIR